MELTGIVCKPVDQRGQQTSGPAAVIAMAVIVAGLIVMAAVRGVDDSAKHPVPNVVRKFRTPDLWTR